MSEEQAGIRQQAEGCCEEEQQQEEQVQAAEEQGQTVDETLKTPSPLRGTGPSSKGESLEDQASSNETTTPTSGHPSFERRGALEVTRGVRQGREVSVRRTLETAAQAAAKSGRRTDVHAYMRLRRNVV